MFQRRATLLRLIALLAVVAAIDVSVVAPASAASGFIESHAANPVSAAPPVSRPPTRHCTVTLAQDFPSNAPDGSPQSFSGTLLPPAACPGPWAKVVLDYTTTVSGRQYDRAGSLQVGGATIWFGTTQEPDGPTPTTFSFSKDVTRYSALFHGPQSYSGGYGNYTSSVYTGVYSQTVTLTFYEPDRKHAAPAEPDVVRGVPLGDLNPGTTTQSATLSDLPRNITRADLEVTLKGNGCDEQWFTAVPDEVAAQFPGDGLCAAGPYREAAFGIDGTPAGAVGTFPHIYSGGIVPTLWRPVLAIDTLDMRPENLDVTPFAGRLVDGGDHTVSVSMSPIGDDWNVITTLFIWTDHHAAQTSGALTQESVQSQPAINTTSAPASPGYQYAVTASRHDEIAGYVDTSAGRIYTRDSYQRDFRNSGQVSDHGLVQSIEQTDLVTQSSTSTQHGHVIRDEQLSESYPISVDFSAADYVNDQNFSLQGTVHMAQDVTDTTRPDGRRPIVRDWAWTVDSTGVLARSNGVTSESDGSSTTSYNGTDDLGRHYSHYIATEHGQIVKDVVGRQ